MLQRIYSRDQVASFVYQRTKQNETLAHRAARNGLFSLLLDEMVEKLGFDVDFWEPSCRLTVINQIVKHRQYAWSETEKSQIVRLMRHSKNLFQKSSFNSTIVRLAYIC
mmetsp:Transcript_5783/g.7803  ORF Transcript_5783/g.7803 Transcript_5783/m.7803 type:complete len:109 (+) Transcript_5783:562-888(+)